MYLFVFSVSLSSSVSRSASASTDSLIFCAVRFLGRVNEGGGFDSDAIGVLITHFSRSSLVGLPMSITKLGSDESEVSPPPMLSTRVDGGGGWGCDDTFCGTVCFRRLPPEVLGGGTA